MKQLYSVRGITLLEIMLVLAIAISLFAFSLKVYEQFKFQADEQKILANVNQLFQGLEGMYYASCRRVLDTDSTIQSNGMLDPIVADSGGSSKVLSVRKDLITPGFISSASWQPNNPLLDNTTTEQGYFIQFNRVQPGGTDPVMSVFTCTGFGSPPMCDTRGEAVLSSSSPPSAQSRVVLWTAQVAVKLNDSLTNTQWTQLKNDMNADCISTLSGDIITPCTSSPSQSGYLVWTRMPSAYHPNITSDYWTSTPYVKQFNQQYTNDPMATLSGVTDEAGNWYNPFNYLCGG
ncbi:MAG TPA: type II secretion system protein [Gammaproteobacteria bacterium]|nr:type II secretion system protein [Gammaproteobacteria bacterium]